MNLRIVQSGSSGNCYILQDDNEHFLILDCGASVRWQDVLAGCSFQIGRVDACLFTHWHKDHLGHIRNLHLSGVKTYSSDELAEYVGIVCGEWVCGLAERRKTVINGSWGIVPWYVPHTGNTGDRVPCLAYLIITPSGYRFVYMTDFMYSPITFRSFNVQTLLIACNHDDDIEGDETSEKFAHVISGHSSLSVVKDIVAVNKTDSLENVILCHISNDNASPETMKSVIQDTAGDTVNVFTARKGLNIKL